MANEIINYEFFQEFTDLIAKTDKQNPVDEDVQALSKMINDHPDLVRDYGDLAQQNLIKLFREGGLTEASRLLFQANLEQKRTELGYENSPQLEKMVIETVLLSWLRLNLWEYYYTELNNGPDFSFVKAAFWDKRILIAQRRYLQTCEMLAKIRKLTRRDPCLQVNIATQDGKQINILDSD